MNEIEMALRLSPQEVKRKRLAIFKHQSQKDVPVFPGADALSLAEYEAVEAFVRYEF